MSSDSHPYGWLYPANFRLSASRLADNKAIDPVRPIPLKSFGKMQHTSGTVGNSSTESIKPLPRFEFIDSEELASRLNLSGSWVRDQVRSRSADPIPHVRFGKYVRFRWSSPELEEWIERRIVSGSNKVAGRALGKESK